MRGGDDEVDEICGAGGFVVVVFDVDAFVGCQFKHAGYHGVGEKVTEGGDTYFASLAAQEFDIVFVRGIGVCQVTFLIFSTV